MLERGRPAVPPEAPRNRKRLALLVQRGKPFSRGIAFRIFPTPFCVKPSKSSMSLLQVLQPKTAPRGWAIALNAHAQLPASWEAGASSGPSPLPGAKV